MRDGVRELDRLERLALLGDKDAAQFALRRARRLNDPVRVARLREILCRLSPLSALERIRREQARRHVHAFMLQAWHVIEPATEFIDGRHLHAICEHLEAVTAGEISELVINMPPRHCKSILCSVMWPAWEWTRNPSRRYIVASYAKSLALRDSRKCRRIIESVWYQRNFGRPDTWKPGDPINHVELTGDANAQERYENTATGYRLATSVGGTGTGEGGDRVISDDAHKVGDVESEVKLQRVARWYFEEMSTRGDSSASAHVIVGQRVHSQDLTGHVLSRGSSLVLLKLPAMFEAPPGSSSTDDDDDTPELQAEPVLELEGPAVEIRFKDWRTEEGELLWPERFDRAWMDKLIKKLGAHAVAGQLQQRPSVRGGAVWLRKWFRFWSPETLPKTFDETGISVDLSFGSTNSGASMCCFQHWGRVGADHYLLDQVLERMSYPQMKMRFKAFCATHPAEQKWVENKAAALPLEQDLKRIVSGIILHEPRKLGSKIVRALRVSPIIQAGNVYIPRPDLYPWAKTYLDTCELFPNAAHDDEVDATSQALARFELNRGSMLHFAFV